ncbi:MAG: hypothetical protein MJ214_04475 [Bacilli bacterium]|nr:hypothetical protein [Bacilli bacterium]
MLNYSSNEELQEIYPDYSSIASFVNKNKTLDFYKFDNFITNKISLFIVHENIDFESIEATVEMIEGYMRYLISIFVKPIINLKDVEEIVPIEMVRKIGSDTLSYSAIHSELWSNFTSQGIKPRKLLTHTVDNDYRIYENQIFAQLVDDILIYLKKKLRDIRNLIFASQQLKFNLLERLDHTNYYLAIGKLHSGYIRNFNSYYYALPLNIRITKLISTIEGYCKYKVYQLNKKRKKRLPLKLTNILKMQKNYHQIYLLAKKFNKVLPKYKKFTTRELKRFEDSYFEYCAIMSIFSITHLNFATNRSNKINMKRVNWNFVYKKWKAQIKAVKSKNSKALLLTVKKDKTYKVLLVPENLSYYKEFEYDKRLKCNEVIPLSPFISNKSSLYIAITDSDSFLRLQQIITRAMVYSDKTHKDCHFCKGEMIKVTKFDYDQWLCPACRTKIIKHSCPTTKKTYYSTTIDGFLVDPINNVEMLGNVFDRSKALHYRNISDINEFGEPICPHCGQHHNI